MSCYHFSLSVFQVMCKSKFSKSVWIDIPGSLAHWAIFHQIPVAMEYAKDCPWWEVHYQVLFHCPELLQNRHFYGFVIYLSNCKSSHEFGQELNDLTVNGPQEKLKKAPLKI